MAPLHSDVILTLHYQGFGIQPSEVVQNFTSHDCPSFVNDQELNPLPYVEQFVNPDFTVPQTPGVLLCWARIVLNSERIIS